MKTYSFNSIASQWIHYLAYHLERQKSIFDAASFVISIDVDVGSPEIGRRNGGKFDRIVHDFSTELAIGQAEEAVIPVLLSVFHEMETPVTFAMRGQLTEIDNSIIDQIRKSSIRHDIGAHGYTHRVFTGLSSEEAKRELDLISIGMRRIGIVPKSFVFPKNKIAHLSLLEKYGYLAMRENGGFPRDGMYIEKRGNLYDVHPSLYVGCLNDSIFSKKLVDLAVRGKKPFHIWFHPWNFGSTKEAASLRIAKVLLPLIKYAKRKQDEGLLAFETMGSIVEKFKGLLAASS